MTSDGAHQTAFEEATLFKVYTFVFWQHDLEMDLLLPLIFADPYASFPASSTVLWAFETDGSCRR